MRAGGLQADVQRGAGGVAGGPADGGGVPADVIRERLAAGLVPGGDAAGVERALGHIDPDEHGGGVGELAYGVFPFRLADAG
jgi:hypothetical protein